MRPANRFFTFLGTSEGGAKHQLEIVAPSMDRAVARFVTLPDRPAAMRWFVRCGRVVSGFSANIGKLHPVTRERFGHAFDGV